MKKYIGAKWLGKYPLEGPADSGIYIEPGGVHKGMPEAQAKASRGWEPVYEGETKKRSEKATEGEE